MEEKFLSLVNYIAGLKQDGANEETIRDRYYRYIEMSARRNLIPLYGSFELTPLCNLNCKMCYVHLNASQFREESLLLPTQWKKIMNEAHAAGMMRATLTGGECLTYPWFEELYLYLRDLGIVPGILSNGLLIDERRIDFFKRYPPAMIQVTLYGSSDDAYEKVTGKRAFKTIYQNLENLHESHLRVSLALTPSFYTREDIHPLMETAESLKLPYGINAKLVAPRKETGRQLHDLEIDQYMEMYRIMKEQRKEKLIPVDSTELPDENREGNQKFGFQCGGGRSSFVIQYNGKMSPCPSMGEISTEPFLEGFQNAWRRLNDLVGNYPMPAECGDCVYHNLCLYCPAMHKNAPVLGHRDPMICERTKRLVVEGFMPVPGGIEKE